MDQERLANLIGRQEIQKKILGNYRGGYSIGLSLNPENRSQLAIRVRIEGQESAGIPSQVVLEGEPIPIIVNTNFKLPEPLIRTRIAK
jgi:hypothetical protein